MGSKKMIWRRAEKARRPSPRSCLGCFYVGVFQPGIVFEEIAREAFDLARRLRPPSTPLEGVSLLVFRWQNTVVFFGAGWR